MNVGTERNGPSIMEGGLYKGLEELQLSIKREGFGRLSPQDFKKVGL